MRVLRERASELELFCHILQYVLSYALLQIDIKAAPVVLGIGQTTLRKDIFIILFAYLAKPINRSRFSDSS